LKGGSRWPESEAVDQHLNAFLRFEAADEERPQRPAVLCRRRLGRPSKAVVVHRLVCLEDRGPPTDFVLDESRDVRAGHEQAVGVAQEISDKGPCQAME